MKTAFSRFNSIMAAVTHFMITHTNTARDVALASVGGYQSRGHGRSVPGKRYRSGRIWPTECGAKQTARYHLQGLHNATVNGFQVIQRA